jgi:hypothetical protein
MLYRRADLTAYEGGNSSLVLGTTHHIVVEDVGIEPTANAL